MMLQHVSSDSNDVTGVIMHSIFNSCHSYILHFHFELCIMI